MGRLSKITKRLEKLTQQQMSLSYPRGLLQTRSRYFFGLSNKSKPSLSFSENLKKIQIIKNMQMMGRFQMSTLMIELLFL